MPPQRVPAQLLSLTLCLCATLAWSQQTSPPAAAPSIPEAAKASPDPIATMSEPHRHSIATRLQSKVSPQFGDRRQGTARNRAAIDWIEAQLKSYGCSNTERIHFDYQPPPAGQKNQGYQQRPDHRARWSRAAAAIAYRKA